MDLTAKGQQHRKGQERPSPSHQAQMARSCCCLSIQEQLRATNEPLPQTAIWYPRSSGSATLANCLPRPWRHIHHFTPTKLPSSYCPSLCSTFLHTLLLARPSGAPHRKHQVPDAGHNAGGPELTQPREWSGGAWTDRSGGAWTDRRVGPAHRSAGLRGVRVDLIGASGALVGA